jgi:hypothetical protein
MFPRFEKSKRSAHHLARRRAVSTARDLLGDERAASGGLAQ